MTSNESVLKKQRVCAQTETYSEEGEEQECSPCQYNTFSTQLNGEYCVDCSVLDVYLETETT